MYKKYLIDSVGRICEGLRMLENCTFCVQIPFDIYLKAIDMCLAN